MQDFFAAIGLMLVLEGILYGGFPRAVKRLAADLPAIPDDYLRVFGVIAIAIGVGVVWLVRG